MQELRFSIVYGTPAVTQVLTHSPDGWDDNFIEIERSTEFHGFMTSFIPKLKFVKDGATLLRNIFYRAIPNYVKAYLLIEKLDKINLTYSQIFYGELKFDTFKDERNFVEITVAEGTLASIIKLNLDGSYEYIGALGDYYKDDVMHPDTAILATTIPFRTTWNFLQGFFNCLIANSNNLLLVGTSLSSVPNNNYLGILISGITNPTEANGWYQFKGFFNGSQYFQLNIGTNIYFLVFDVIFNRYILGLGTSPDDAINNYYRITVSGCTSNPANCNGLYNIVGLYNGQPYYYYHSGTYYFYIYYTTLINKYVIAGDIIPTSPATIDDNWTWFGPPYYVSACAVCDDLIGTYVPYTPLTGTIVTAYTNNVFQQTTPAGIYNYNPPYTAIGTYTGTIAMVTPTNPFNIDVSVLITILENPTIPLVSLIQAYYFRTRDLTMNNLPNIALSLNDIYKSLACTSAIGMGIELIGGIETLIFKKVEDFYLNTATDEIENIGEVADDFKLSLWDKAINSVKIGYANRTYDNSIDDRLEFNATEAIYTINNKLFTKQLDKQSKFRADWKGIWGIYNGIETQDEDIFFTCLQWATYAGVTGWFFWYATSQKISTPTTTSALAYNVPISTVRCLQKNINILASLSFAQLNDYFYLTPPPNNNDKKNSKQNLGDIKTEEVTGVLPFIYERQSILISAGTKFLLPFIFEFTGKVSENFTTNFKANPNGFITFAFKGETYKGFISKAKYKPTGKEKCTFTLISAPDNDLTKLIR